MRESKNEQIGITASARRQPSVTRQPRQPLSPQSSRQHRARRRSGGGGDAEFLVYDLTLLHAARCYSSGGFEVRRPRTRSGSSRTSHHRHAFASLVLRIVRAHLARAADHATRRLALSPRPPHAVPYPPPYYFLLTVVSTVRLNNSNREGW